MVFQYYANKIFQSLNRISNTPFNVSTFISNYFSNSALKNMESTFINYSHLFSTVVCQCNKVNPSVNVRQSLSVLMEVTAYATAEKYDLLCLKNYIKHDVGLPIHILTSEHAQVMHISLVGNNGQDTGHTFFFEEGAVVFWNINSQIQNNILNLVKKCEHGAYKSEVISVEKETLQYSIDSNSKAHLEHDVIILGNSPNSDPYERYACSNALALSVKLGIWETNLDILADGIQFVYEELKKGRLLNLNRGQILRKCGELFALRHNINLNSDLLDTPDFYWDKDELEQLYGEICRYFSIGKRTRVINEKLQYCCELMQLLDTHLSDRHHVRLEIMIIILILVEVIFELLHFFC